MWIMGMAFVFQYLILFANDYWLQCRGWFDLTACVLGVSPLVFLLKTASKLKGLLDVCWMTAGNQMVL